MIAINSDYYDRWKQHGIYYAKATDEIKRQAQRKLDENTDSVFKENIAFKYGKRQIKMPISAFILDAYIGAGVTY